MLASYSSSGFFVRDFNTPPGKEYHYQSFLLRPTERAGKGHGQHGLLLSSCFMVERDDQRLLYSPNSCHGTAKVVRRASFVF